MENNEQSEVLTCPYLASETTWLERLAWEEGAREQYKKDMKKYGPKNNKQDLSDLKG